MPWGYDGTMLDYPNLLKTWRKQRRFSQLSLATEAEVSSRHISFLETGRASPSAAMIVHLCDVLDMPVDARNQMLVAAGFAPRYARTPIDDATMAPIHTAIARMLDRHAPYPALVLDRHWNAIKLNCPAQVLFAPLGITEGGSFLDLVTNPAMPVLVENWAEVAHHTMLRLRAESLAAGGLPTLDAVAAQLATVAQCSEPNLPAPTIPTVYRFGDERLSLFGTVTHFSTVNDETLADLKVELFYPNDKATAAWFEENPGTS
ncbi:MAG: helix-turn-helix domain-containing protein [Pseudomonadota bacterium]